jgi:hypothetical protein
MTGSKRGTTGPVELCRNVVRLQALHRAPKQLTMLVCEARRRTASERETRTEELCEVKWDYHIVSTRA